MYDTLSRLLAIIFFYDSQESMEAVVSALHNLGILQLDLRIHSQSQHVTVRMTYP